MTPFGLYTLSNSVGRRPLIIQNSGWIEFFPSGDSLMIYCSSSTGSDSFNGLSPATPKKTIAAAIGVARPGFPDWVHLKRGDVWVDEEVWVKKSGRSSTEPLVITYYGAAGGRPLIRSTGCLKRSGGGGTPANIDFVFVNGLEFYNYKRDPADPAFDPLATGSGSLLSAMSYWTIQDCKFSLYKDNLSIQKFDGAYANNIRLHRNIFVDSWGRNVAPTFHSSGIYCDGLDELEISENFFDHNGWNLDVPANAGVRTIFNHNMYLQGNNNTNLSVWGNISCRGSSHGIQQRSGGLQNKNLFIKNAIAHFCGGSMSTEYSIVTNNVSIQSDDLDPGQLRGWGCELMKDQFGGEYEGNIYLNRLSANAVAGMFYNSSIPSAGPIIQVLNNVVKNWANGAGKGIDVPAPVSGEFNLVGNINNGLDQAGNPVTQVDPTRDIETYMSFIGVGGNEMTFIDICRNRGLHEWNPLFSAGYVVDYIKAGYAVV